MDTPTADILGGGRRESLATFRALLRTGYLNEVAEELADGFSEGKRDHQLALVTKAEGAGPRAVLRYRAFMTATDDIIEKLRAAGRRA